MPPQIDFSKYGLAQPTPTAGKIDFSKYGLNQPSIPKAPAISANRMADIETAQKYGATFTPSTENQGYGFGEAAKTVGNIPKSAFNFVKSSIDFINPISTFGKVKQAVSEFKGLAGEAGGYGKAFGALGKEMPKATYEGLIPEAGRGIIKGVGGLITGNALAEKEGFEMAQRAITADPVGQIGIPLLIGRGIAGKAGYGPQYDTAISKTAAPVTKATGYAFGKAGGAIKSATKFGVGQEFGLEPKTVSRLIEKPGMQPISRETLGSMVESNLSQRRTNLGVSPESISREFQTALAKKNARLGVTPDILGKEIQGALNARTSALAETGGAYGPVREANLSVKVSKNWLNSTIKDLTGLEMTKTNIGKEAKAPILKKGELPTITYDKTVPVERGKTTFKATGESVLREASDVRAIQHIHDLWQPVFERGKMTSNEFLNFRADMASLSKFERQIGKSQPIENMAKIVRGRFNESYRPQLEGLETLDKTFGYQIKELKEMSKGLVDKNGQLTDAGLAKIAKAKIEKPNFVNQLEEVSPGIMKKVDALNEQRALGKGIVDERGNITDVGMRQLSNVNLKEQPTLQRRLESVSPGISKKIEALQNIKKMENGLVDDAGNITDRGMSRIANALNESNPLFLKRLEEIVPGIAEKIKDYRASADIEAAKGNKVGVYARSGIGAGAAFWATGSPTVAVGVALASRFLLNPSFGVWLLRKYGSAKSSAIINLIRSVGSTINQLPNQRPPILKKDIRKIKTPAGMSIEDITKITPELEKEARFYVKKEVPLTRDTINLNDIRGRGLKKGEIPSGKENLNKPVIVAKMTDGRYQLLDGRHRLDILEKRGDIKIDAIIADKNIIQSKPTAFSPKAKGEVSTPKTAVIKSIAQLENESAITDLKAKYKNIEQKNISVSEVRDKTGLKLQDPHTAEYLPTNPDGTITVYHSTTKAGAEKIKQTGIFGSKTEGGDIYFTTNKKGYGGIGKDKDTVLAFNVDPKKVRFDDVYRGELHLKGNNADIGGIKPVNLQTKSQLTDIWKKANNTAFSPKAKSNFGK